LRLGDLFRKRARRNPLEEYFAANPGRMVHKWHHYFEIYHRHFERFRGRSPVVVEIGVYHGGSLQMWREYFGEGAHIVGVDINPECRMLAGNSITILIGDQADRDFLAQLRESFPRIDIVIDDGGHKMAQQIATFEELYPHLQPDGVYLCEDIHTSHMPEYGGGYLREGTFIEYTKGLIDHLHSWYIDGPEISYFTRSTFGLHLYGNVMVAEKRPMQPPVQSKTGTPSF
jgi:SAM-dependent methyltransferase